MNLTVKEVAEILRVGDRTVRNFVARGDLPAVRIGHKLLIAPKDLEVFCRLRSVVPTAKPKNANAIPQTAI
jgi:excisionase family DNA binding protein